MSGVPVRSVPNSSEKAAPNLPVLLPSNSLPEAVSLLLLPEELKLLSGSMVESKFVESLNSPGFYIVLAPDEDGECHGQKVKT